MNWQKGDLAFTSNSGREFLRASDRFVMGAELDELSGVGEILETDLDHCI